MPSTFRCTDCRRAEGPYDAGGVVADSEVVVQQPPPGQLFGSLVSAFGCPETVAASRSSIMWRGTFYAVENICTHQGGSLGIR